MRKRRSARCLLYLVLFLALTPGCQALHSYRPVVVQVRDAETNAPLPAAEVYLTYPLTKDSMAPCTSSGITREDGITRLRAAPAGKYGIHLQGIAQGYLTEDMNLGVTDIEKIETAHLFEAVEKRPVNFVLTMYREPRFTVELVLPAGYRGLVKAEVQFQEDTPGASAQREYRYEVSPTGTVVVKGPALLRRVTISDYHARYAGGAPLSGEMDAVKVGFRWLKEEGKEQYFVVGTQAEYEALRRRLVPEETKKEIQLVGEGKKGGGRGGHHHRGGQTSDSE